MPDLKDLLPLLSPWAITPQAAVDPARQASLGQALNTLLRALDCDVPTEGARLLDEAMAALPSPAMSDAQVQSQGTGTHLSPDEVLDYNRYFSVKHVESEEPALCMVRSLIGAAHCFLGLRAELPSLDATNVDTLLDGLRRQAHLLVRNFQLAPLASPQP